MKMKPISFLTPLVNDALLFSTIIEHKWWYTSDVLTTLWTKMSLVKLLMLFTLINTKALEHGG